jgi:3',5'-cyclic AMP phosphodiesterase CpdA
VSAERVQPSDRTGQAPAHRPFRIAHLSDTHVLSPTGVEWRRVLFNKRITGHANLMLRRGRVYRREYLDAVVEAAAAQADHVVVTGDITNLALESEFDEALALFSDVARRVEATVVPGNHDIYLPSIHRERRFPHHFGSFLESDLPQYAIDLPAGRFPCVKLRGPTAIIALSSAVPRPPFVSAGYVGAAQLEALAALLDHPDVRRRLPVVLVHHPPINSGLRIARLRDGLVDSAALRRTLGGLARGLVLYGHIHRRMRCQLRTAAGSLDLVAASGAALDHPHEAVRAGFNLYEIDDDGGIVSVRAHVVDASGRSLQPVSIGGTRTQTLA